MSTINRSGEQVTGYLREELRMLDPNWIFGADYLDAITQMISEGADSAPRTFRSEFVPRKGARVPVDVQARVLVGDGEVVGVTSIARDLSERDRLENELRQAQKMEAVGRLATGIAHDFNNLITVLLGYSDELIEEAPPNTTLHAAAVEVRRAADRASALTQQLLAFSRRQVSVAQAVDLNQVIAHMEDLIRRLLGPEIRLRVFAAARPRDDQRRRQQIGQVMMNLVVNARDAMPDGGTLTIETANVELGHDNVDVIPGPARRADRRRFRPRHDRRSARSAVRAVLHDQGVGQRHRPRPVDGPGDRPPERRPHQRRQPARQGHDVQGLLPAAGATSPMRRCRRWRRRRLATVRGEGVVLLAEDDRSVRRLVVSELTRRGFTVLEAEDGAGRARDVPEGERSHRRPRHRRRDAAHEWRRSREGGRAHPARR